MSMETMLWHKHISKDVGNEFGFTMQVSPFYKKSQNETGLGKYFGIARQKNIRVKTPELGVDDPFVALFPAESIVHDPTESEFPSEINAELVLKPESHSYGFMFGLFYDLKNIFDGLAFKAIVPVVHTHHDINLKALGQTEDQDGFELLDYFHGKLRQTADDRLQSPLKFAKIDGGESTTSVADILATLSFNFLEGEKHAIALTAGITIPTGNEPDGFRLFEPIVGNGGFIGLHGGVDGSAVLWDDENFSLDLIWRLQVTHLFSDTQKRVLGLKSQAGNRVPWGQYRLVGEIGKKGVFPFANVSRTRVRINPGNQVEALAAFSFNYGEFSSTIGVNVYGREGEKARVKRFKENIYGLTKTDYDTKRPFEEENVQTGETLITKTMLDTQSVETPGQVSTKIAATIGYVGEGHDVPLIFGVGGAYEFGGNNSIFDGFEIWGTAGISF